MTVNSLQLYLSAEFHSKVYSFVLLSTVHHSVNQRICHPHGYFTIIIGCGHLEDRQSKDLQNICNTAFFCKISRSRNRIRISLLLLISRTITINFEPNDYKEFRFFLMHVFAKSQQTITYVARFMYLQYAT
jgi:hypothetical protein